LSPADKHLSIDSKRKALPALMLKLFPNERKLNKTVKAVSHYLKRAKKKCVDLIRVKWGAVWQRAKMLFFG